jgi:hypothetical protein
MPRAWTAAITPAALPPYTTTSKRSALGEAVARRGTRNRQAERVISVVLQGRIGARERRISGR